MSPRRREARVAICAAAACAAALLAGSARADTSDLAVAYQIDAAHTGVQTDSQLSPPFSRRWRVTLPAQVSYPLIAEGKVFVTAASSASDATWTPVLYALDQASGRTVWSQRLPLRWPRANAAYEAGKIFVVGTDPVCCSNGAVVLAYAADTGNLVWRTNLPWEYATTSAPTAAGGVVYVSGSGAGHLYALSADDGRVLATQPVTNGDDSSPAVSDSGVFVSYACDQAFGFAPGTLAPLWHYSTFCSGGGGKTVVYAAGRVYTRDFLGSLVLDASSGSLLRTYEPERARIYAPAVDSDMLFATFPGDSLHAETLAGTPLWTFAGDGQINTTPLVLHTDAGRFVIVGSSFGDVYALDAVTGGQVWRTNVGAPVTGADEQNASEPLAGLAAGQGVLVVPAANTVSAFAVDHTPPHLALPPVVTAQATAAKPATVTYAPTATDPDDTAIVDCTPASGTSFVVGITPVACTATDTAGNTDSGSFFVVVSAASAECDLTHYAVSKGSRNLKNATLAGCYLPGAALAGANATAANMSGAYLVGADLGGANLSQANLRGAMLTEANLADVKWSQTTCPDGALSNDVGGTCAGHLR